MLQTLLRAGVVDGGLAAIPAWVLRADGLAADVDMDFANASYRGANLATGLAVSRASGGYAQNADGTLTWFGNNQPRIGVGTGLLIEEARINTCLQSQTLDHAYWSAQNLSVSPNSVTAPDGTLTADTLVESGVSSVQRLSTSGITLAISTTYTMSLYAKYVSRQWLRIGSVTGTSFQGHAWFDLLNGVVGTTQTTTGTIIGSKIEALANGWYRCSFTFTTAPASTSTNLNITPDNGNGQGFGTVSGQTRIWGVQVEVGSSVSSYIPTTAASVQRAADAVVSAGLLQSLLQGSAATVFGYMPEFASIASFPVILSGDGATNYMPQLVNSTLCRLYNGTQALDATLGMGAKWTTHPVRFAFSFDGSGRSNVAANGTVVTDANGIGARTTAPNIGRYNSGSGYANNYIERIAVWGSRISNTALKTLTVADPVLDVPSWVLNAGGVKASVDIDLANDRYWGDALSNLLSCSRASSGYAETVAGTLTSFGSNTLRRTDKGLLIEEARTNLILQSQTLDNAAWSATNAAVTANGVNAPDGTATADALIEQNGVGGTKTLSQSITKSANALLYAYSVYVKALGAGSARRLVMLLMNSLTTSGVYVTFDIGTQQTGTITAFGSGFSVTGATATIQPMANGWYRCVLMGVTSDTSTSIVPAFRLDNGSGTAALAQNYTGDGVSGLYLWGAQLEQAILFPTSYIPTTTVAVTRAADNITLAGAALSLLGGAAASVFAQVGAMPNGAAFPYVLNNNGGTIRFLNYINNTQVRATANSVALSAGFGSGGWLVGPSKMALAWDASGRSLVANNGTVVSDATSMAGATTIYVGTVNGATQALDAYITRLAIWSSRIANDNTLKGLTA